MSFERALILAESNIAIDAHNGTLLFDIERQAMGAALSGDGEDEGFHGLLNILLVFGLVLAEPVPVVMPLQLAKKAEPGFRKSIELRGSNLANGRHKRTLTQFSDK